MRVGEDGREIKGYDVDEDLTRPYVFEIVTKKTLVRRKEKYYVRVINPYNGECILTSEKQTSDDQLRQTMLKFVASIRKEDPVFKTVVRG